MSKPVFGLILGGALGIFDGLTALLTPEVAPMIVQIVIGSFIKGLIAGISIGFFAKRFNSLPLGIIFGLLVGLILAYLVAAMQGKYYFEIMLPGGVLGVIVGFATQRFGKVPAQGSNKENTIKSIYLLLLMAVTPSLLTAQGVHNTSYVTSAGEKVLRIECVIPAGREEAWKLLSSAEGWKRWAAPVVSMDFRIGGAILTNYDSAKTTDDSGTIRLPITNYIERELITLKVSLNETFPKEVRDEDRNLQEIIQLADGGKGKTKIISSMIGWGTGQEWEKTYTFFSRGNTWTSQQIVNLFHR